MKTYWIERRSKKTRKEEEEDVIREWGRMTTQMGGGTWCEGRERRFPCLWEVKQFLWPLRVFLQMLIHLSVCLSLILSPSHTLRTSWYRGLGKYGVTLFWLTYIRMPWGGLQHWMGLILYHIYLFRRTNPWLFFCIYFWPSVLPSTNLMYTRECIRLTNPQYLWLPYFALTYSTLLLPGLPF